MWSPLKGEDLEAGAAWGVWTGGTVNEGVVWGAHCSRLWAFQVPIHMSLSSAQATKQGAEPGWEHQGPPPSLGIGLLLFF